MRLRVKLAVITWILLGFGTNLALPLGAGEGQIAVSSDAGISAWTVRRRVSEVRVFFSATHSGKFVDSLSIADVRVMDNYNPVIDITHFGRQQDLPLRVGILIDTSGSVDPRFTFEQQAAIKFLRTILRPGYDRAFVMGFSDHLEVGQDYSDDPNLLAAGVARLHTGGGTAFLNSVVAGCRKLADEKPGDEPYARILIVLSDGNDNTSHITLAQALREVQLDDVTVYAMNTRVGSLDRGTEFGSDEGDRALKRLAKQTGGRFFSRPPLQRAGPAFVAIEQELRNRYALFYRPNTLVDDDRFRAIRIVANKSGRRLRVRCRKGYYATGMAAVNRP